LKHGGTEEAEELNLIWSPLSAMTTVNLLPVPDAKQLNPLLTDFQILRFLLSSVFQALPFRSRAITAITRDL